MKLTRRSALGLLATTAVAATPEAPEPQQSSTSSGATLDWLGQSAPAFPAGITWGVPWPRGTVRRDQTFTLTAGTRPLPLQSWPLSYWPDGSMKFTAFATVAAGDATNLRVAPGTPTAPAT